MKNYNYNELEEIEFNTSLLMLYELDILLCKVSKELDCSVADILKYFKINSKNLTEIIAENWLELSEQEKKDLQETNPDIDFAEVERLANEPKTPEKLNVTLIKNKVYDLLFKKSIDPETKQPIFLYKETLQLLANAGNLETEKIFNSNIDIQEYLLKKFIDCNGYQINLGFFYLNKDNQDH